MIICNSQRENIFACLCSTILNAISSFHRHRSRACLYCSAAAFGFAIIRAGFCRIECCGCGTSYCCTCCTNSLIPLVFGSFCTAAESLGFDRATLCEVVCRSEVVRETDVFRVGNLILRSRHDECTENFAFGFILALLYFRHVVAKEIVRLRAVTESFVTICVISSFSSQTCGAAASENVHLTFFVDREELINQTFVAIHCYSLVVILCKISQTDSLQVCRCKEGCS